MVVRGGIDAVGLLSVGPVVVVFDLVVVAAEGGLVAEPLIVAPLDERVSSSLVPLARVRASPDGRSAGVTRSVDIDCHCEGNCELLGCEYAQRTLGSPASKDAFMMGHAATCSEW